MRAITKIPPCGAINLIPAIPTPTREPVRAEPTIKLGIARTGAAAPNGIAPSVMNESPITMFVKLELHSSSVNLSLNKSVATKTADGGTHTSGHNCSHNNGTT